MRITSKNASKLNLATLSENKKSTFRLMSGKMAPASLKKQIRWCIAYASLCRGEWSKTKKSETDPEQIALTFVDKFDTINQYPQAPPDNEELNIIKH